MNTLMEHGNAMYPSFWFSWPGILSLVIMGGASLHNIFSICIDDDIIDRLYYWSVLIICTAALLHIYYHSEPRAIMKFIIICLAIRFVASVVQSRWRYHKNGGGEKTFGRRK